MERVLGITYSERLLEALQWVILYSQQSSPLPEIALSGICVGLLSIAIVQTYSTHPWMEWWRTDLDEAQEEMARNLSSRKKNDLSNVDDQRDPETAESIDNDTSTNDSTGSAHRRKGQEQKVPGEGIDEDQEHSADTAASSANELTEHERKELGITKQEEERLRKLVIVDNPEDAKTEVVRTLRAIIEHVKSGRSMEDLLDVPLHQRILRFLGRRIDLIVICSFVITAVAVLFVNDPDTLHKVVRYIFPKESNAILETIRRFKEDTLHALDSKDEL